MNSQLNNSNDNQDQVFQEDTFRPVFFDLSSKRNSTLSTNELAKRVRLDAGVVDATQASQNRSIHRMDLDSAPAAPSLHLRQPLHHTHQRRRNLAIQAHAPPVAAAPPDSSSPHRAAAATAGANLSPTAQPAQTQTQTQTQTHAAPQLQPAQQPPTHHNLLQVLRKSSTTKLANASASLAKYLKAPKFVRRFRLRSLPIINYLSARSHVFQNHLAPAKSPQNAQNASGAVAIPSPPLPPINLQSLKEIDLHEILKNPQLRHDILFDPQLQFRPNLDGERGRKKKTVIDKYWGEIQKECAQFFTPTSAHMAILRLPMLFSTLRDILLSLLPYKDRAAVNEIMDIELLVQQLKHGSFDFVLLSRWLGEVFKSHCAPMRDQWVSDMMDKFQSAFELNSVEKLVQGLRMIFSILEAMKLDVANHQIRILRPVLIETAVDFEKDYFSLLMGFGKIDISDSLKWFYKNYHKKRPLEAAENDFRPYITASIIDLLSCRNMATEFPSTLAFDHTRLVLLRADVRQLVCVQLCIVLYKQLLLNYKPAAAYVTECFKPANLAKVQEEILSIVTDDNGNIKWTRNVQAILLQLVKNVVSNPQNSGFSAKTDLPQSMIDFSYNWLIKQIQPNSDIYGLMEDKIFKDLIKEISANLEVENSINLLNISDENALKPVLDEAPKLNSETKNIALRISTLVKFHWNVFGSYYSDYLASSEGTHA